MLGGKGETKLFNYFKHLKELGYLKVQLFLFAFIFNFFTIQLHSLMA
jgi:hypothetical protein